MMDVNPKGRSGAVSWWSMTRTGAVLKRFLMASSLNSLESRVAEAVSTIM